MESAISYFLIAGVCCGFLYSYLYFVIEGVGGKWWETVLMAVLFPIFWIYENWIPIVGWFVFFAVLFGIPVLIVMGCQFIERML